MANAVRSAIMRALVEGVLTDLMVKTNVENVYVDDSTTLAAKLAELIASLNAKATTTALESGLNARPTTEAMDTAISTAIANLINGAPEAYNSLKELADAMSENAELIEALNAAIGNKADASTVAAIQQAVNNLGSIARLNEITESNLSAELKEKVNAASEGNHSHSNKSVLDGITSTKVAGWDGKGKFYAQANQPTNLAAGDLWAQII